MGVGEQEGTTRRNVRHRGACVDTEGRHRVYLDAQPVNDGGYGLRTAVGLCAVVTEHDGVEVEWGGLIWETWRR